MELLRVASVKLGGDATLARQWSSTSFRQGTARELRVGEGAGDKEKLFLEV
jgi:hypothetical protein